MHPELSGRENLFIGGVIAGLSYREVAAKFDEILAFSELEDFIDSPVRTYSAGMKLRLGFAAAVHGPPGVLLIDEVLSVGDGAFQAKCLQRIRRYKEEGAAIVVVTHDLGQMTAVCDAAIWLKRGTIMEEGPSDLVANSYRVDMARHMLGEEGRGVKDQITPTGVVLRFGENRFGSLEQEIHSVRLLDTRGKGVEVIESGSPLQVEVVCAGRTCNEEPKVVVTIGTSNLNDIVNLSSLAGEPFATADGGYVRKAMLEIDRLDLAAGDYLISVGLYDPMWSATFDLHWRSYKLKVTTPVHVDGMVLPPHRWKVGINAALSHRLIMP
jgi:lipopolysaccharide transport system ATP-binding protein